jgi:tetratricopeptide (TPR) repeat protein
MKKWILARFTRGIVSGVVCAFSFLGCVDDQGSRRWVEAENYHSQGQFKKAIEEFNRIAGYSGNPEAAVQAYIKIASIYLGDLKNEMSAIKAYKEALQRTKDSAVKIYIRKELAKVYLDRLDRPLIAAEELRIAINEGGQNEKEGPDLFLLLGKAFSEGGNYAEAALTFEKYRSLFPGHSGGPRSLFDEAQAQLADRRYVKAISLFQQVIEKFSGHTEYQDLVGQAYYGLGSAFESSGELERALEAYKQGLTQYPNKKVIELKIERVLKRQKEKQI